MLQVVHEPLTIYVTATFCFFLSLGYAALSIPSPSSLNSITIGVATFFSVVLIFESD